jgi:hypothetical protein
MWKLLVLIAIASAAGGFALGYGVRAGISYRRRTQAERIRLVIQNNKPTARQSDELPRALRDALAELSRRSRRVGTAERRRRLWSIDQSR